uniref:Uncharacterized protein n=1 Tax=Arundo donax TaxID=35708 RepID=A0A0A8ZMR9_ARUDO
MMCSKTAMKGPRGQCRSNDDDVISQIDRT